MAEAPAEILKPHHHVPASWPAPLRGLAAVSRGLALLEGVGIGFCLLAVIALATYQFAARNLDGLALHLVHHHVAWLRVPDWTHGVIRHSVFLLGFLGGAYATYTGRHIRIDAVTRTLKARPRLLLRVVTTLFAIAIVTLFVKAGWEFYHVAAEEANEATQIGEVFNSARGALIIVAGYSVMIFHFAVQVAIDIGWLASGKAPPPEWIAEAAHGELTAGEMADLEASHEGAGPAPAPAPTEGR